MNKKSFSKLAALRILVLILALFGVIYLSFYLKSEEFESKPSAFKELFAPAEERSINLKSWSQPEQFKKQSPPLTKTTENQ